VCCCPSSCSRSAFFRTATTAAVKSLQDVVEIAVLSNELHGSLTEQLRALRQAAQAPLSQSDLLLLLWHWCWRPGGPARSLRLTHAHLNGVREHQNMENHTKGTKRISSPLFSRYNSVEQNAPTARRITPFDFLVIFVYCND
jgi:hypothetical protein